MILVYLIQLGWLESSKQSFIKLAVFNPSLMQRIQYMDKDIALEIVSQRPRAFEYLPLTNKTMDVLNKVIELKGNVGKAWIEQDAKDNGYYDAYINGGLRK